MNLKSENALIDIIKIIMAILVVCIHTNPLDSYSAIANFYLIEGLGRVAVPVFFIYVGYFLRENYKNITVNNVIHGRYYRKLLIMYVVWMLIYSPIAVLTYKETEDAYTIILFKCIRDFIFVGFKQYWYLLALLVGIIIVVFFYNKFRGRIALVICLLLYIVSLLGNGYYAFYHDTLANIGFVGKLCNLLAHFLLTTRNGLFFSPLFIMLGFYMAEKQVEFFKNRKLSFWVLSISGMVLLRFIEVFALQKYEIAKGYAMTISLIPLAVVIVAMSLDVKVKLSEKNAKYIRKLSTLIYLLHTIVWYFVCRLFSDSFIVFISTLVLSMIFSMVIIVNSNTKMGKILKKIY